MELTDLLLERFFLDNYEKAKFIINKKSEIKTLLKKLIENEMSLEKLEDKAGFIPKEQQDKINYTQQLWELLLREAIYCLRDEDEEDRNEFK